jgi:hypothetical protein
MHDCKCHAFTQPKHRPSPCHLLLKLTQADKGQAPSRAHPACALTLARTKYGRPAAAQHPRALEQRAAAGFRRARTPDSTR